MPSKRYRKTYVKTDISIYANGGRWFAHNKGDWHTVGYGDTAAEAYDNLMAKLTRVEESLKCQ